MHSLKSTLNERTSTIGLWINYFSLGEVYLNKSFDTMLEKVESLFDPLKYSC